MGVDKLEDVRVRGVLGGLDGLPTQLGWQVEFFRTESGEEVNDYRVNLLLDVQR